MRFVIALALLGSLADLQAQREAGNLKISRIMSRIPDSLTLSTGDLAGYINREFQTPREKSRAIFIWIAKNINYNFDVLFENNIYDTPSDVVERVLKTRNGVCLQYAELFNEIANKTGIKCFVIQGYTQQHGVVDFIPHVWCAAYIDTAWYLIDPTWGSGFISGDRFVSQVNNSFFMATPKNLIKTHIPFDPLWQFLNYPVTNREFYERNYIPVKEKPFFNFEDSLQVYLRENEVDQFSSAARRIEMNGVVNTLIATKLQVLKGKILYYRNKDAAEKYNSAVNTYNSGIEKLNQFISYKNNQFESEWDSVQLTGLLDSTEYLFKSATDILKGIIAPDSGISASIVLLNNAIRDTWLVLNEQRTLLYAYLKTWKKI